MFLKNTTKYLSSHTAASHRTFQNFCKALVIYEILLYNRKVSDTGNCAIHSSEKGAILMIFHIALLCGNGIGSEIVGSTVAVLQKIGKKYGNLFNCTPCCAINAKSMPRDRRLSRKRQRAARCRWRDLFSGSLILI